jgi:hypothetical protein
MLAWVMLGPAAAQPLDPASQSALDKTLQILLDPQARSGELSKSSQGAAVHQQRALPGPDALTQAIYQIAGRCEKELAQSAGDPPKMPSPWTGRAPIQRVRGHATRRRLQRLRDLR